MRAARALDALILLWFSPTFAGIVMPVDKVPAPKGNQGRQRRTYTSLAKVKRKSWLRNPWPKPVNRRNDRTVDLNERLYRRPDRRG